MKLAYVLRRIALIAAGITLAVLPTLAQDGSFSVEVHEQTATLPPGGFIDFKMEVRNNTNADLNLSVARITNDRPDNDWMTAICYDDLCFVDTMSYPPVFKLKPGQMRYVKVNFSAGMVPNTKCRVVMEIASFTGEVVSKEFEATVATSGVNSPVAGEGAWRVYPNPATSYAMIPLPVTAAETEEVTLQVFDARGTLVADLSRFAQGGAESIRLDLTGLANGTYHCLFNAGTTRRTSAFVLAR